MKKSIDELAREIVDAMPWRPNNNEMRDTIIESLTTLIPEGHVLTREGDGVRLETKDGYMARAIRETPVTVEPPFKIEPD